MTARMTPSDRLSRDPAVPPVPGAVRWSFRLWLLIAFAGGVALAAVFSERVRIGLEVGDFVLLFPAVAVLGAFVAVARAARAGRRRARAVLTVLTVMGLCAGVGLVAVAALYGDADSATATITVLVVPPVVGQVLMYVPAARSYFGLDGSSPRR
ncbi:hypothetical protein PUR61_13985 [Streptomyces sp. BE20]|uniref:hypothetical protein n=1 Tax=Streptomyces sp. BE20 TaxID=3002525 RepID=UPI002E78ED1E|nr:hypothetical protein [Streptomyces sp. BE20]MEE1823291.1 hypothetical protein [Streptomyces sp. BE20]